MIIKKAHIRTLKPYRGLFKKNQKVVVGVEGLERFRDILIRIGFPNDFSSGDTVLPRGLGPISTFNAEGKDIKHKDQPMETAYREVEWHWVEWHGPYRIPRSRIVDVPYKRYPRTFVPPPSVELQVAINPRGGLILISPAIEFRQGNEQLLIHTINLFLEIFGESMFFTENLDTIIKAPVRRLNWRILPPGRRPWEQLNKELAPLIAQARKGNQVIIEHRLATINRHKPDFTAIGEAGFRGYIVFGFSKKNVYALESLYYGNATYIFGEDWEKLSKMTKAEILNESLQKDRVIHREGWEARTHNILKSR